MYRAILFVYLLVISVCAKNELYSGSKIYNVKLKTPKQQEKLGDLKNDDVDFLRYPSFRHNITGRVLVPSAQVGWFEDQLFSIGVAVDVQVHDVQEYLRTKDRSRSETMMNFAFDGYYRYDQILAYLNTVQEQNNNVEVKEYGKTAQDRSLVYVKISNDNTANKPVIIIEAAIIPREWITVPAAINAINKLLEVENTRLLNAFDWIVIPVMNPDGYEYTHTDLRYWTKTLSTSSHLQSVCPGANINRNFDINWLVSGSSSSPCSHIFSGIKPFSEIESQMVKSLLEEYGDRIRMFLSLQNNGPFITYPWQFDKAASGAFRLHHLLGLDIAGSVTSDYITGVASMTTDERISGTSSDFAQRSGVLYSFNLNLKQDENDDVLVPESEIPRSIEDAWRAISIAADGIIGS